MAKRSWLASNRLQRVPSATGILVVALPLLSGCASKPAPTPNNPGNPTTAREETRKAELAASTTVEPVPKATTEAVRPFRVHFPDDALSDLHRRLAATRWPDQETVRDRSQGVQLSTMKELASYWRTDYDWRWSAH